MRVESDTLLLVKCLSVFARKKQDCEKRGKIRTTCRRFSFSPSLHARRTQNFPDITKTRLINAAIPRVLAYRLPIAQAGVFYLPRDLETTFHKQAHEPQRSPTAKEGGKTPDSHKGTEGKTRVK
jgi:hypothetical protein